jgi:hypothetical protein
MDITFSILHCRWAAARVVWEIKPITKTIVSTQGGLERGGRGEQFDRSL